MVNGPERLAETRSTPGADLQQPIRDRCAGGPLQPGETLAYRLGDGRGLALTGEAGQFTDQAVSLFVLDVDGHVDPFYHDREPFYPYGGVAALLRDALPARVTSVPARRRPAGTGRWRRRSGTPPPATASPGSGR